MARAPGAIACMRATPARDRFDMRGDRTCAGENAAFEVERRSVDFAPGLARGRAAQPPYWLAAEKKGHDGRLDFACLFVDFFQYKQQVTSHIVTHLENNRRCVLILTPLRSRLRSITRGLRRIFRRGAGLSLFYLGRR